jgi:hypothetical protein
MDLLGELQRLKNPSERRDDPLNLLDNASEGKQMKDLSRRSHSGIDGFFCFFPGSTDFQYFIQPWIEII